MTATEVWDSLDDGWKGQPRRGVGLWRGGSAGVGAAVVDRRGAVVR